MKPTNGRPKHRTGGYTTRHTQVNTSPNPYHRFNIGDLVVLNSGNTGSDNDVVYLYITGSPTSIDGNGISYFGYVVSPLEKPYSPLTFKKQEFTSVKESDLGEKLNNAGYWISETTKAVILNPSQQSNQQQP